MGDFVGRGGMGWERGKFDDGDGESVWGQQILVGERSTRAE